MRGSPENEGPGRAATIDYGQGSHLGLPGSLSPADLMTGRGFEAPGR